MTRPTKPALASSASRGFCISKEEIKKVWEHQKEPWVDTVLILLYSGWRISELLNLKPEDINLQAGTMKGGTKTKAGKDLVVPIHSKIRHLVESRLAEGGPRLISYNGRVCSQTQYRVFWADIMKFEGADGQQRKELIHHYEGPGVLQGMHNLDDSITSFARCCFNYALDTKQNL